jgi:tRNA threonylcarbamoyladenosine biosynthesis protein TsaE
MQEKKITINSPYEMEELGASLALLCGKKCIIYFIGELGAGKTTLIRGFLRALGHNGIVKSPTYTLVESYQFNGQKKVYHFDLYRLVNAQELEFIGIRDYFSDEAICLVEWADRAENFLPKADLICRIDIVSEDSRSVVLNAKTLLGEDIIDFFQNCVF